MTNCSSADGGHGKAFAQLASSLMRVLGTPRWRSQTPICCNFLNVFMELENVWVWFDAMDNLTGNGGRPTGMLPEDPRKKSKSVRCWHTFTAMSASRKEEDKERKDVDKPLASKIA